MAPLTQACSRKLWRSVEAGKGGRTQERSVVRRGVVGYGLWPNPPYGLEHSSTGLNHHSLRHPGAGWGPLRQLGHAGVFPWDASLALA
jgi:hypothetical protein